MQPFIVCFFLLTGIVAAVSAAASQCPRGYYRSEGRCHVCRECPQNQIIRRACGPDSDTVCGPFKEFNSFLWKMRTQNKANKSQTPFHFPAKPPLLDRKDMLRRRKLAREWSAQFARANDMSTRASVMVRKARPLEMDKPPTLTPGPSLVRSGAPPSLWHLEQWQELCFGLLGGLAVVSLLLILYILLSHWRARRNNKAIADADPENSSIYSRARIFSRDRLSTTEHRLNLHHLEAQVANHQENRRKWMKILYEPKDPLLEGNGYADEVFEPKHDS